MDVVAKECSVATLVQGSPSRERDRLEAETVQAARMSGASDAKADVEDAAVENKEKYNET